MHYYPTAFLRTAFTAICLSSLGLVAIAEPSFSQSLSAHPTVVASDQTDVEALYEQATQLYEAGRYEEAIPLMESIVEAFRNQLPPDHPNIATSLNNLALLYHETGRYEESELLHQQAIEIRESALGTDHPGFATSLNNLAGLYRFMGRYGEAEPLYQQALEITESTLGADHSHFAASLNNLAGIYSEMGRYGEAEPLYQQALEIDESALGADHPDFATSLNNLAGLYRSMGRYGEAEPLHQQALEITESALGADHPSFATRLNNLAALYEAMDRYGEAEPLYLQASEIEEENLARILAIGSEAQKQDYLTTLISQSYFRYSFALNYPEASATHLGLTTLLRRKGRILDAVTDSLQQVRQHLQDDPAAQSELEQLTDVRNQLAALTYQDLTAQDLDAYQARRDQLIQKEQRLESSLSRRSAEFAVLDNPVTVEAVQAAIPNNAALVEFVRYSPYDFQADRGNRWGEPRYAAYILPPDGNPQHVDLGAAADIEQKIAEFRDHLQDPVAAGRGDLTAVNAVGRQLHETLIEPLEPYINSTEHLLLSPDGDLNLIPFEALVDQQQDFLIQHHQLSYLSSGRDLLRLDTLPSSQNPPMVVANPDYNQAAPSSEPQIATQRGHHNRRSADLANLHFGRLLHSQPEGTALESLLDNVFPQVNLLLGEKASEDRVKNAQAPSILHISTHGFFLPNQDTEPPSSAPGLATDADRPASLRVENPLLRAGLALANANAPRPEPDSQQEDGILTALELAGMNLVGTQLVVLSACETGTGEVANGEGVYGLRRALVMAGAQSQVLSLWQVEDETTKHLMVDYYSRLMNDDSATGRHQALRQAQLEMLNASEYRHPYYWAAFVSSGDWRSLSVPTAD